MSAKDVSANVDSSQLQPRAVGLVTSTRPAELGAGVVLDERYLIQQLIGSGGVSLVWRARDLHCCAGTMCNVQVTVKIPRPELHDHERARLRLSFEYRYTKALSHPNIVRVFELRIVDSGA